VVAALVGLIVRARSPQASPSPSPSPASTAVAVPDVLGETDVEAITDRIASAGLVPIIKYRHSASPAGAVAQEPGPAQIVTFGTPVEVVVAVVLTPPTEGTVTVQLESEPLPSVRADIPRRVVATVGLSWGQAETYVRRWRVVFMTHACRDIDNSRFEVATFATDLLVVDAPQLRTVRHYTPRPSAPAAYSCPGWAEAVHVEPLDDFGQPGPGTAILIQPALSL
jgi:hypothetical protein